MLFFYSPGQV